MTHFLLCLYLSPGPVPYTDPQPFDQFPPASVCYQISQEQWRTALRIQARRDFLGGWERRRLGPIHDHAVHTSYAYEYAGDVQTFQGWRGEDAVGKLIGCIGLEAFLAGELPEPVR
jgi:hypothetical protein